MTHVDLSLNLDSLVIDRLHREGMLTGVRIEALDEPVDRSGISVMGRILLVFGAALCLWGLWLPTVTYREEGHLVVDHLVSLPPVLALVAAACAGLVWVAVRGRRRSPMPGVLAGLAIPLVAISNATYVVTEHASGHGVGVVTLGLVIGIVGFTVVPSARHEHEQA